MSESSQNSAVAGLSNACDAYHDGRDRKLRNATNALVWLQDIFVRSRPELERAIGRDTVAWALSQIDAVLTDSA